MPRGVRTRRAHRVAGAVVAVIVFVAALAGCGDDGGSDAWDRPVRRPGPVLLVGDSIFFQSATELVDALKADGWDVVLDARPGAGILRSQDFLPVHWPSRVRDLVRASRPAIAVIELGTNGCGCRLGDDPGETLDDAVDAVLEPLDGIPVLWLRVRESTEASEDPAAVAAAIERAAGGGHVRLLPYDEWFDARPELLDPDGVHLRPEGERYLAERITAALAEVAR
jgi:lysophospholipase L1-like esterase